VTEAPRVRRAARALLLDPGGRILLFRAEDPGSGRTFWLAPGGGIAPGETPAEAAAREVREETGIADFVLGPAVWTRRHVFPWNGAVYDQRETYFLARTAETSIDRSGWTPLERAELKEHRWWTVAEIAASGADFAPRRLAALLEPLLRGEVPGAPLDTGP
jgi:8-oxo-dGTP pyrophosphatase MutT (NUDIX family)